MRPRTSMRASISAAGASIDGIAMTMSAPSRAYCRSPSDVRFGPGDGQFVDHPFRDGVGRRLAVPLAKQVVSLVRRVAEPVFVDLFVVSHRHLLCEEIPDASIRAIRVVVDSRRNPRRDRQLVRVSKRLRRPRGRHRRTPRTKTAGRTQGASRPRTHRSMRDSRHRSRR